MTDVFVYYRVRREHAAQMRPRISALQAALAQDFDIHAALKRRPDEIDGMQTWMEIYADVPDDFLPALQQAVVDARLPAEGERHLEIFVDLPECA